MLQSDAQKGVKVRTKSGLLATVEHAPTIGNWCRIRYDHTGREREVITHYLTLTGTKMKEDEKETIDFDLVAEVDKRKPQIGLKLFFDIVSHDRPEFSLVLCRENDETDTLLWAYKDQTTGKLIIERNDSLNMEAADYVLENKDGAIFDFTTDDPFN